MDIDIYTTTTVATFNLEEQFKAKKKNIQIIFTYTAIDRTVFLEVKLCMI